ncbi:Ghrelin O-acyltransferase [Lemmus lemmus]
MKKNDSPHTERPDVDHLNHSSVTTPELSEILTRPPSHRIVLYLFLLAGGGVLALAAMGPYALLIFIPALCAVALVSLLGPPEVHKLTFVFQMGWQTLCHLGLHYTEYYLQEPAPVG